MNIGPNDPSLQSLGTARPTSQTPALTPSGKVEVAAPVAAPKEFLREVSDDVESIRESEYRSQASVVQQEIGDLGKDGRFAEFCQSLGIDPHGSVAGNLKKMIYTLGGDDSVYDDLQAIGTRMGVDRLNQVCLKCLKSINAGFLEGEQSKELRQGNVRTLLEELASQGGQPGSGPPELQAYVDSRLAIHPN